MRALKGLVIGMGLLIVAGLVLLVYGLYQKANDPDFVFFKLTDEKSNTTQVTAGTPTIAPPVAATQQVQPSLPQATFGETAIPLSPGDKLSSMIAEGNRLIMHIRNNNGDERVVVTDMNSGALLGAFNLKVAQ